jgi:hypothetical protein
MGTLYISISVGAVAVVNCCEHYGFMWSKGKQLLKFISETSWAKKGSRNLNAFTHVRKIVKSGY